MAYQEFGVDRVRQQQELHAVGWALLCRSLPYEPASWDDVTRHEAPRRWLERLGSLR